MQHFNHNSFISLAFLKTSMFGQNLAYSKLVKRGYRHSILFWYIKRFCLTYNIDEKYGKKNHNLLFSLTIKYSLSVSCDINNIMRINDIVKKFSVHITTVTSSFKHICKNKPLLPTDVFDDVNTPISCINTMNIDDIERSCFKFKRYFQAFYNTL